MDLPRRITTALLALAPCLALAQAPEHDLLDEALLNTFKRQNERLVCLSKAAEVKDMRAAVLPLIQGVDLADRSSLIALVMAIYQAFPCPFSPQRPELRPAGKGDLVGYWLFPEASLKLQFGPQSPAWQSTPPGVPALRCEGVLFDESGEFLTQKAWGPMACATRASMQAERQQGRPVAAWMMLGNGRVRADRTDGRVVPAPLWEWEAFVVQAPFEFFGVKFAVGDLALYQRRTNRTDTNAATRFLHLQRLN